MGTIIGDNYDHEGFIAYVLPDGRSGGSYRKDSVFASYRADGSFINGDPERFPDTAVVGWKAACECGWSGRVWPRATTADPTAGSIYSVDAMLDEADEEMVLQDFRTHVAAATVISAVRDAQKAFNTARWQLDAAVVAARNSGATWEVIGRATGSSKQSAHEKWGRLAAETVTD